MSDFKDRMIEAVEQGFTTEDNAYEYVRDQIADVADRKRDEPPKMVGTNSIPTFVVGDRVVWDANDDLGEFRGTVTRTDFGSSHVIVKLDVGGTFEALREDLQRL